MDELITFIRARLDEDERGARDATPGPWSYDPGKEWYDGDDFVTMTNGQEFVGYGGMSLFRGAVCITGDAGHAQSAKDAEYIAGHDPARALRETEAGRRTLARHTPAPSAEAGPLQDAESPSGAEPDGALRCQYDGQPWPCPDLRDLAAPYADHPGYRDEWRP
ncbi:hypothetical protein GCM10009733_086580 [Nonomuraea maheshkhaliensis]|uniref:Uncharacterized protein n=1 Tax=Nonomuraea maheshkhaliensis TaxID=419590 RepID=A0ABN2GU76_9ACTN